MGGGRAGRGEGVPGVALGRDRELDDGRLEAGRRMHAGREVGRAESGRRERGDGAGCDDGLIAPEGGLVDREGIAHDGRAGDFAVGRARRY